MATPAYTGSNATASFGAASGPGAMSASVTSGNLIIVCVAWSTGGTALMSKSAGTATIGAFTQIGSTQLTGGGGSVALWACSVTGSGTLTLTLTASTSTFNGFTAMEWSNLTSTQDGTPPAVHVQVTTGAGPWTIVSNSITTSVTNSVVFGVATDDGGTANWSLAGTSGWTAVFDGAVVGNPSFFLYTVEASAGTYAPSGTLTNSNAGGAANYATYTVALKASGAVADPYPAYMHTVNLRTNPIYRG